MVGCPTDKRYNTIHTALTSFSLAMGLVSSTNSRESIIKNLLIFQLISFLFVSFWKQHINNLWVDIGRRDVEKKTHKKIEKKIVTSIPRNQMTIADIFMCFLPKFLLPIFRF